MAVGAGKRHSRTCRFRTKPKPQRYQAYRSANPSKKKARRGKPIQQKIDKAEKENGAAFLKIQTACEAFFGNKKKPIRTKIKQNYNKTLTQLTEIKVKLTQIEENWLLWQEELEQILTEIDEEFTQL